MAGERLRNTVGRAAVGLVGRLKGSAELAKVSGGMISVEKANRMGEVERDWMGAALVYNAVFEDLERPMTERAEALVGLSQMLINMGYLEQAEEFLRKMSGLCNKMSVDDRGYFWARRWEKQGWIEDYRGNYDGQIDDLEAARVAMGIFIPRDNWGEREKDLDSTVNHFLGRANYGKATLEKDKKREKSLERATRCFREDLARYEDLRRSGCPRPDGEGYNHAWLGRCDLLEGKLGEAWVEIERAGELFAEHAAVIGNYEIMAHYHQLLGAYYMESGGTRRAREEFEAAYLIRSEKNPNYPKGEADALLGIAASYWAEGKMGAAFVFSVRAVRTFPPALIRSSV